MNDLDGMLLTVQEVSAILKLSVLTIYKYIREQKLEALEFGGHYRIKQSSLHLFINSHKVQKDIQEETYEDSTS